ncbi:MAG: hypothetical protein ACR2LK_07190, partial [Solirubrobacteraceae bacterium]
YLVERRLSHHHEGVLLSLGFARLTTRILPAQADVFRRSDNQPVRPYRKIEVDLGVVDVGVLAAGF